MSGSRCLINTPLQRGDRVLGRQVNRFSGCPRGGRRCGDGETAEAVKPPLVCVTTLLKQGVNESKNGYVLVLRR